MKKIFIMGALLLSTPLWAQYYGYTQNTANLNNLQSSAVNVAPGVSIITPFGGVGVNPYSNNLSNNSNVSGGNVAPGAIPMLNETTGAVTIPAPKALPNNGQYNTQNNSVVNNTVPTQPTTQQPANILPTPIAPTPVAIKPVPKPAIVNGSISDWNKTTQKEIEVKAQADLEEKYKAFLYKR